MRRRSSSACLAFAVALALPAMAASAESGAAGDDHAAGRKVFLETAQPSCAICHKLADAGATGAVGPGLDQLAPSADRVRAAVTKGIGVMPAFEDKLSAEEIDAVAAYVADVAGTE